MHELDGQMSIYDLGFPSLKMFAAPTQATEAMISKPSSKPLPKSQTPMFLFLSLKKENGQKPPRKWIVRRLTPTECARLQGFPDMHGHPDHKDSLTDEEYAFWLNVRNTHAMINGRAQKQYTREQMLKCYNGLHTDSAEYKMWGNGIALPCAAFVLGQIAKMYGGTK